MTAGYGAERLGAARSGYGVIKHERRLLSTHVVSFVLHGGTLAEDRIVTHSCDNRLCVNPAHLKLGTFADNVVEMHERRAISALRGNEAYNAVLTEQTVRQMREYATETGYGYVRVASHFGVNRYTVRNALNGKTWKHV